MMEDTKEWFTENFGESLNHLGEEYDKLINSFDPIKVSTLYLSCLHNCFMLKISNKFKKNFFRFPSIPKLF